ncbi:MAG: GAD-like domain-containing protein [Saprospiraceae bacterium]
MKTLLDFKDFVKIVSPVETYKKCPISLIKDYTDIIPESLLNSWEKHGFQKFGNGFIWTTDPDSYRYLTKLFIPQFNSSEVNVLFRTSFSDFIFLYKEEFYHYSVVTSLLLKMKQSFDSIININFSSKDSLNDGYFFNIHKWCVKKLGIISIDEIYAYVPALQFGGEMVRENLQKQNMKSYLTMVADLGNEE